MVFDPKTLSNNDLFEKQLDLIRKKLQSAHFGKTDTVNQIQAMIDAIEMERRERMFNERIGVHMLNSHPVVLETDPVLRERDAEEVVITDKPKPDQTRPIKIPVRTTRPVNPEKDKK